MHFFVFLYILLFFYAFIEKNKPLDKRIFFRTKKNAQNNSSETGKIKIKKI